jgi:hypothetical protein
VIKMRTFVATLLVTVLTIPVLASAQQPEADRLRADQASKAADRPTNSQPKAAPQAKKATQAKAALAADRPTEAQEAMATSASKAKPKPARKKISAENARGRAMLDAAIEAQWMQVMQSEANRQAALQAEQARFQNQQAQQLDTIRRLSPQGTTIARVRPDGSFDTNTYYVYPNLYTLGTRWTERDVLQKATRSDFCVARQIAIVQARLLSIMKSGKTVSGVAIPWQSEKLGCALS